MLPESYVPDEKTREVRDLVRTEARPRRDTHRVQEQGQGGARQEMGQARRGRVHARRQEVPEVAPHRRAGRPPGYHRVPRRQDRRARRQGEDGRRAGQVREAPHERYPASPTTRASSISSEIADIDRFADHEHLCSYAGLVPGLRQSADKSHTTTSRTRSALLNWVVVQCTRVHVRWCDSAITRFYKDLAKRRGENVAIVAAARKLMRAMYIMLKEEQAFRLDGRAKELEPVRFLRHRARFDRLGQGYSESHNAPQRANGRMPIHPA